MSNSFLADRLVQQQQYDQTAEERFKQEVRNMLEKKLTPVQRGLWMLSGLLGFILMIFFICAAVMAPSGLPLMARITFIVGAAFGAVWIGVSVYIIKQGFINLKTHENRLNGLTWGFMVVMTTSFLLVSNQMENRLAGISLVLHALVFFVMFAVPAIISLRINSFEFSVREQLLRMEIALAEMQADRNDSMPEEVADSADRQ